MYKSVNNWWKITVKISKVGNTAVLMKLEQSASSSYLRHAARNSPNWSIFDVMKSLPLFHFIMVVNFSLLSSFEAQNLTHFGVLKMHCWCNHFGSMAFSLFHIKATIYSHFKVLWNNNKALILQNCPGGEKKLHKNGCFLS